LERPNFFQKRRETWERWNFYRIGNRGWGMSANRNNPSLLRARFPQGEVIIQKADQSISFFEGKTLEIVLEVSR
jgi:hypothetical protein